MKAAESLDMMALSSANDREKRREAAEDGRDGICFTEMERWLAFQDRREFKHGN